MILGRELGDIDIAVKLRVVSRKLGVVLDEFRVLEGQRAYPARPKRRTCKSEPRNPVTPSKHRPGFEYFGTMGRSMLTLVLSGAIKNGPGFTAGQVKSGGGRRRQEAASSCRAAAAAPHFTSAAGEAP